MPIPDETPNCPFYGRSMVPTGTFERPFLLIGLGISNRCALILDAHSPCKEEIAGRQVNWGTCGFLKQLMP